MGQPRIVVFHEKEGRRHCHAVWSRIDADEMKAVPLPHLKMKMRDVSREIFLEQGWKLPRGLMNSKESDPRNFTLAEWQQAKRAGLDARDLKEAIQECWAASDSAQSFSRALESRGLYLARGDRRSHVAVAYQGEAFSIARVTGRKSKDISARLGDPAKFRSVIEAKAHIASQVAPRIEKLLGEVQREKRAALKPLNEHRLAMRDAHAREREKLLTAQKTREQREVRERAERLRTGVRGLWDRLTGERAKQVRQNEIEALAALKRDADQRESLRAGQLSERRKLQIEIVATRNRYRDKAQSLHADLHRLRDVQVERVERPLSPKESFQQAAQPEPQKSTQAIKTPASRLEEMRRSADRTLGATRAAPNQTRGLERE